MGKKVSPKKENEISAKPSGVSGKIAGLSNKVFGIIKFILGVCFLPFVYSVSVAFFNEFSVIEKQSQNYFWSGIVSFIIIYLFVFEPAIIYAKGQRLLEIVFSFFRPLVKVAPYVLPIYTIVLFIAYWILSLIIKSPDLIEYFLFLFGSTVALHLIFGARSLRSKQEDFLKANYIFGFSFVYIINLVLVAIVINFIFEKFSLVNFLNSSFQIARDIFCAVFKQLFLYKS